MSEEKKKHVPLPEETHAFVCANCGAVALDQNNIRAFLRAPETGNPRIKRSGDTID